MKILVGIHEKDAGQINYHNQEVVFKDAQMSEEAGITFIHQELNIWPELTVLENLFIGKEMRNKFGILNEKKMKQEALKVFGKLNFNISLKKVAGKCSIGEQQMIEIAKALMTNAKLSSWMNQLQHLQIKKSHSCLNSLKIFKIKAFHLFIFHIEWLRFLRFLMKLPL